MSLAQHGAGAARRHARGAWPAADKPGVKRLLEGAVGQGALRAARLAGVIALDRVHAMVVCVRRLVAQAAMMMCRAAADTSRALTTAVRQVNGQQVGVYSARTMRVLVRTAWTVAGAGLYGVMTLIYLAWRGGRFLILHNLGRRGLEIGLALAVIWLLLTPRARQMPPDATHAAQPVAVTQVLAAPLRIAVNPTARLRRYHGTRHPRTAGVSHHAAMPVMAQRVGSATSTALSRGAGARAIGQACRRASTPLPQPGPCGDLWRRAEYLNLNGRLMVPPSASVRAIWHALWAAGSPLAANVPRRDGKTYAEYLWDEGKVLGIDPAVVMGIFRLESQYGTLGMARLTHSLGNIRPVGLQPEICGGDGCYAYANDWFDGIDRIYSLLRQYVLHGASTVDQVIPIWAPPSDYNNDTAYLASVRQTMQDLHAEGQGGL